MLNLQSSSMKERKGPMTIETIDLKFIPEQRRIFKGDELIHLTTKEYRICERLLQRRGGVVTREELLDYIWDSRGNIVNDNTLNVHISRIRKKFGCFSCIETVRNDGYRWACEIKWIKDRSAVYLCQVL